MPHGMEVGLGPGHIVLDGDPAPQGGTAPQFPAYVYCGQTAGWIKMPFVTEVGLGPGNILLDGDPDPLPKGHSRSPLFGTLWPNGWMDQDATWLGAIGLGSALVTLVRRWTQLSLPQRDTAPIFRPMSIVGKRSPSQLGPYC